MALPRLEDGAIHSGIMLTGPQVEGLDRVADARDVSRAAVIRWAISYYLKESADARAAGVQVHDER